VCATLNIWRVMAGIKAPISKVMALKPILVAKTHKQVFTSPELLAEHARWLDLADTALHNPGQIPIPCSRRSPVPSAESGKGTLENI
jgi:hypothetical protein